MFQELHTKQKQHYLDSQHDARYRLCRCDDVGGGGDDAADNDDAPRRDHHTFHSSLPWQRIPAVFHLPEFHLLN